MFFDKSFFVRLSPNMRLHVLLLRNEKGFMIRWQLHVKDASVRTGWRKR